MRNILQISQSAYRGPSVCFAFFVTSEQLTASSYLGHLNLWLLINVSDFSVGQTLERAPVPLRSEGRSLLTI